jgi:replication factor A1
MNVDELKPYSKKVELTVKILKLNEIREVQSKLDQATHKVTEALVGDSTGTVLLTLWDDTIAKVGEGNVYNIGNAYTSLFKSSLRLNLGRYGTLEESSETIETVKEDNNLSEKELSLK